MRIFAIANIDPSADINAMFFLDFDMKYSPIKPKDITRVVMLVSKWAFVNLIRGNPF